MNTIFLLIQTTKTTNKQANKHTHTHSFQAIPKRPPEPILLLVNKQRNHLQLHMREEHLKLPSPLRVNSRGTSATDFPPLVPDVLRGGDSPAITA